MQSIHKRRKTVWLAGVIPALLLGIFCGAEEYVVQIDGVIWPETGMTVGESLQRNADSMTADIGTLDHLTWYIDGREEALRETDVFEAGRDYLLWMRLDLFTEEEYIARAELPKDAQEKITAAVTVNGEELAENHIQ
ncbi:MAG: hypothetical protein IJX14_01700, partial [Clostridia bacterium]|nr:hypothetical protein [Clostridia bacterium]